MAVVLNGFVFLIVVLPFSEISLKCNHALFALGLSTVP
jgi:hypothetical protein